MNDSERFIIKPFFNNLSDYRLNYKDILTYITLRSFYNSKDKYCFPSYETIAKRAQLSKTFITQSIKRLEAAGFIEIWKVGKVRVRHCYKFSKLDQYQKIPYAFLDLGDLTTSEKAMLLLLREHFN